MKKPLKHFILNLASIAILSNIFTGVSYDNNITILLTTSLILSLANLLVKPILKIILLPINIITFGLAGWLIQVIILYLTTLLVDGFTITAFAIGPLNLIWFIIPSIVFSGFFAYLAASLGYSIINSFIFWVL